MAKMVKEYVPVYARRADHERIAAKAKSELVPIYAIVRELVRHLDEIQMHEK
jgi:hypothetical protein